MAWDFSFGFIWGGGGAGALAISWDPLLVVIVVPLLELTEANHRELSRETVLILAVAVQVELSDLVVQVEPLMVKIVLVGACCYVANAQQLVIGTNVGRLAAGGGDALVV